MSKDAVSVATLFGAIFVLRITFAGAVRAISEFMTYCITLAQNDAAEALPAILPNQFYALLARTTGPLLGAGVFLAVAATFAQTQMLVAFELIKPKFEHVNPLQGVKRLFSLRSVVEAAKNLLKVSLLLFLIYRCLRDMMGVSERFMYADLGAACAYLLREIFSMLLRVSLTFLVLAALDFLYQWWDFERQMRMSKQEIKEEYKQIEGDPQIKSKIKELQRRMSQSRMMQQVPQADVIIRNPTHVAVALRYRYREDPAPIVLAKGQGAVAQRIVEIAQRHDILVMENVALARALYAEAELNQAIPSDLFEAVAEVMVYLYRLGRIQGETEELEGATREAGFAAEYRGGTAERRPPG